MIRRRARRIQSKSTELTVMRARARLCHAIQRGAIQRPTECPQCKVTPGSNALGQAKMWALFKEGFENWDKPTWRCIECYRAKEPT